MIARQMAAQVLAPAAKPAPAVTVGPLPAPPIAACMPRPKRREKPDIA
jgi:hypothetical protein